MIAFFINIGDLKRAIAGFPDNTPIGPTVGVTNELADLSQVEVVYIDQFNHIVGEECDDDFKPSDLHRKALLIK